MGNIDFNYDFKAIGQRIKQERKNLGYSQEELGDLINYTRRTISSWEKGESVPELSTLLNLCNLFKCELGYLLCEYATKSRMAVDICKETKLTEKALNAIIFINENIKADDVFPLNFLLESVGLRHLMWDMHQELVDGCAHSVLFGLLEQQAQKTLRLIFRQASFEARGYMMEDPNAEREKFIEIFHNLLDELDKEELLDVFHLYLNFSGEVSDFVSKYINKSREEIINMFTKDILFYAYPYLVYETKQKERYFLMSEIFLDIVKDFIKSETEGGSNHGSETENKR